MARRLEVRYKDDFVDAAGNHVKRKINDYFGINVSSVRVIDVYTINMDLSDEQFETISNTWAKLSGVLFTTKADEAWDGHADRGGQANGGDCCLWICSSCWIEIRYSNAFLRTTNRWARSW